MTINKFPYIGKHDIFERLKHIRNMANNISIKGKKWLMIFLFIASAILFLIASVATLTISIKHHSASILWNEEGFKNFFDWFDFPVKLYAACIALLTLAITSMRAFQFDKSLELLSDNNKFNNFYKHREEFIKFMNQVYFFNTSRGPLNQDKRVIILPFYDQYYYKNYKTFQPAVSDNVMNEISTFYNRLKIIGIENTSLNIIEIDKLREIDYIINNVVKRHIYYFTSTELTIVKDFYSRKGIQIEDNDLKNETDRVTILTKVFYSIQFYEALMSFDGQEIPKDFNFKFNYDIYRKNLKYFNQNA